MNKRNLVLTMLMMGMVVTPLHAVDGPQYGDEPTGPNWNGNDQVSVIQPVQTGNTDTIRYVPLYDDDTISVYMMDGLSDDYGYTMDTVDGEPVITVMYQNQSIGTFTIRNLDGDAFVLSDIPYDENGYSIYDGVDHSEHCLDEIILDIVK